MGRSTQFRWVVADEQWVKLFGRDDRTKPGSTTVEQQAGPPRPKSRLNEQCAKLREVHVELDDIEGRLTALRARNVAARLRATAPRPAAGKVETIDLRTLEEAELTHPRLDDRANEADVEPDTAQANTLTDVATDDDFEKRFAAFAAGQNDDSSRRWLDTD